MQYVDITNAPQHFDQRLTKRLGFKRVLNVGEGMAISERGTDSPFLIRVSSQQNILSALKSKNAIGVIVEGEELDQKIVSRIKDSQKIILINAYYLTISQRERISKIHKYKKLFRMACKAKAGIAIASMAPNEHYLLSFMQLFEIAKLITGDEHQAKKMINTLGETL
ncbi:MAG: hypothetical protein KGH59_02840 [Candidatus Micrarchaeota archaeon]|nr:hypothetical protein [Candidatus Micrarchaeota archaeon]MDE1804693.1 hypothetical protein [Candidatus Micrarchaeota archaeon]MDE1846801.1 hypothetical protein [Candidatus Micrarchaeota archaeon]